MSKPQILFGICGSFCNHARILHELYWLKEDYDLHFVISEHVAAMSTRFFKNSDFRRELNKLSDAAIIDTITESEKIGPNNSYDLMVIAPATANTIAKLVNGIYDTSVTLAAKAMQRNDKPLLIGLSTNDFIGISGANLLRYTSHKHIYTLPMVQDDIVHKPRSMSACFELLKEGIEAALKGEQLQPIFREAKR